MPLHASYTLGCGAETLNFHVSLVTICWENLWTGNGISGAKKKKQLAYIPTSFMWLLFGNNTIWADCLLSFLSYKFLSHLSVFFLFVFNFTHRTYGLHIWEMLSMAAPGPRTHCLCEVIHIWSSLLLLIITHHYYKQVQSWLPSFWLQGKKIKKKQSLNFQRNFGQKTLKPFVLLSLTVALF